MKLQSLTRSAITTTKTAAKVVTLDTKAMKNAVGGLGYNAVLATTY